MTRPHAQCPSRGLLNRTTMVGWVSSKLKVAGTFLQQIDQQATVSTEEWDTTIRWAWWEDSCEIWRGHALTLLPHLTQKVNASEKKGDEEWTSVAGAAVGEMAPVMAFAILFFDGFKFFLSLVITVSLLWIVILLYVSGRAVVAAMVVMAAEAIGCVFVHVRFGRRWWEVHRCCDVEMAERKPEKESWWRCDLLFSKKMGVQGKDGDSILEYEGYGAPKMGVWWHFLTFSMKNSRKRPLSYLVGVVVPHGSSY